ncbi:MAG: lipopolysaccharide biosynthesis protein [Acidobacteria bacterium]|nr:lipopolysaccharide biosynthesis protein [Acidobacteriota bacterium]
MAPDLSQHTDPVAPVVGRDRHFRTDRLKANLGARTARGGIVTIASQGFKFAAMVVATVVLARLLRPTDYGLVGMVAVVTGFVTLFKDMGLSAATVQHEEITHAQVSTLFWVNVALSVGVAALTAVIAPLVAWFYGEPRLTAITLAYCAGFLFSGLTVQHEALLRRQMRFGALSVGPPSRDSGVRSMLVFGGNFTGFSVINYFARNIDNVLIGRFWGSQQLGLYVKAYQLLLMPLDQINSPITTVAVPALSRLNDAPQRYRSAYLRILEKVAMLTMPGIAFMIAVSDWLVLIVLGPQWTEAGRIFAVLGIAALVQPITNTTGWLFITQGRTRHMLQWGVVGSTLIVISIVVGLPWGTLGVATSYSLVFAVVVTPLLFYFVGRSGPVRAADFYVTAAPAFCASLSVLASVFLFRRLVEVPSPLVGLAAASVIALVSALAVLCALPAGRKALRDAREMTAIVLRGKETDLIV